MGSLFGKSLSSRITFCKKGYITFQIRHIKYVVLSLKYLRNILHSTQKYEINETIFDNIVVLNCYFQQIFNHFAIYWLHTLTSRDPNKNNKTSLKCIYIQNP